jgi:hypothetical protein
MKIRFWKDEGAIVLIPKKMYRAGYDLQISFSERQVCFSIGKTNGNMTNVQLSYEEFAKLLELLNMDIVAAMKLSEEVK